MLLDQSGSFRLFRFLGIEVRLHWLWFLAAWYMINERVPLYSEKAWAIADYLALFAIVLTHEFGHALACRSVGGRADRIILWPLGGVAFVQPPMRPGPFLWSIAAGPLVNVVLVPITFALMMAFPATRHAQTGGDLAKFIQMLFLTNLVLLIFNILPIYPLDGGQILQCLLWFFMGFARSLQVVAVIGLVVAVAGGAFALSKGDTWLVFMAVFVGWQAFSGFRLAGAILRAQEAHTQDMAARQAAPPPYAYPPIDSQPPAIGPNRPWPEGRGPTPPALPPPGPSSEWDEP